MESRPNQDRSHNNDPTLWHFWNRTYANHMVMTYTIIFSRCWNPELTKLRNKHRTQATKNATSTDKHRRTTPTKQTYATLTETTSCGSVGKNISRKNEIRTKRAASKWRQNKFGQHRFKLNSKSSLLTQHVSNHKRPTSSLRKTLTFAERGPY